MKQLLMICLLVVLGAGSSAVLADQAAGESSPGGGQNFDQIKQRLEQRMQQVISKMQERLSCIQNAQDPQTLRACMPKRGMRRHAGEDMGRPDIGQ